MPRRVPLRDATNEAPPKKPLTVTDAASIGTHKDLLVAMRARVATAVQDPNTPARDLAALTRRLMEIAKDIEAIDAQEREEAEELADAPDEDWSEAAI